MGDTERRQLLGWSRKRRVNKKAVLTEGIASAKFC